MDKLDPATRPSPGCRQGGRPGRIKRVRDLEGLEGEADDLVGDYSPWTPRAETSAKAGAASRPLSGWDVDELDYPQRALVLPRLEKQRSASRYAVGDAPRRVLYGYCVAVHIVSERSYSYIVDVDEILMESPRKMSCLPSRCVGLRQARKRGPAGESPPSKLGHLRGSDEVVVPPRTKGFL
eukprot:4055698-Pyramimonas_sp.AAC.1